MISQAAIQAILGIKEKTHIRSEDMAEQMAVSFYPQKNKVSDNILKAEALLRHKLASFGVREIPYPEIFIPVPAKKRYKRFVKLQVNNLINIVKKVFGNKDDSFYIDQKTIRNLTAKYKYRSGVCIVVPGVLDSDDLPMQYIKSFKDNSIISILDFPDFINESSSFEHHFDASMEMFAHNMANIVLAVDSSRWMIYNFNASHPIFDFNNEEKLDYFILNGLIPKVVAPISPHTMSEFVMLKDKYDPRDGMHAKSLQDLREGSLLYGKTGLFPAGKKINDLKFRNNFHKQIGKIHLDSRSGMSFGFTAKQVRTYLSPARFVDAEYRKKEYEDGADFRIDSDGNMHAICEVQNKLIELQIPEVWVLTLRSGSDKTNFNPDKDLIKIGLKNGQMHAQLPNTIRSLPHDYKPSFDTKVILAHAVGNAINATIARLFGFAPEFVHHVEEEGHSLSHWHGYFQKVLIPPSVYEYGRSNPHVACSSPQSAIYALDGKLACFREVLESGGEYVGDIHVEPHHGSNVCYPKLVDIVQYILEHEDAAMLGNKYL